MSYNRQNIIIRKPPNIATQPAIYTEPGSLITQPKFYAPQNLNVEPKELQRGSFTPLLIIFVVVLIIIAVALLYAFRDKIFKKGATLASAPSNEQSEAGYGTYGPEILGLCKTSSGLCSDTGSQTITQQCIPNPITGFGCLDKDGNQTFSPKVSNQNCTTHCRQFKFVETTRNPNIANEDPGTYDSICKYYPAGQENLPNYNDIITYPCLPSNSKIGQYYVKRNSCLPNDKVGTNECSVTCGEIDYLPNGFTISPIEDPNSVLYIPVCDKVLQASLNYTKPLPSRHFYFGTFPWEIAFSLPENGVVIGKGFTIKNSIDPTTGTISLSEFEVDPPYVSPYDSDGNLITDETLLTPSSTLTVQQLEDLDNNLYTYQSCSVANPRPTCGNYYLYSRTQFTPNVGVNETTLGVKPLLDPAINTFRNLSNGQYYASRNCYYNDYNSGNPNVNTRFKSPYNFTASASGSGYYTEGYEPYGIGMFGYINDELTCLSSITVPSQVSPDQDNAYNVPPYNGLCLGLNTLDNSSPVPDNDLNSSNCFPLGDTVSLTNGLLPENLPYNTDYPPAGNNLVFNTCNTQIAYEQGPVGGPGVLSVCRYMPNNEDLYIDPLGVFNGITDELKRLLGYYIRMGLTDSSTSTSKTYYLTLENTPCDCTSSSPSVANCLSGTPSNTNLAEPFGNCNGSPNNFGVGPINTMLVYNGDPNDPFSGGVYWERPGCDSYLMSAVNALQLIISPTSYDSINDKLECNILATFMGSYNGTLGYYFNAPTPTYGTLTYIPLKPGDINKNDNNYVNSALSTEVKFAIKYNSTDNTYEIYGRDPNNTSDPLSLPLLVSAFDGTGPLGSVTYTLTGSSTINIILYNKPISGPSGDPTIVSSAKAFIDSNLIPFNPYFILNNDGKYEQQPIVILESGGLYPSNPTGTPPVINNLAPIVATQQSTCSPGIQTCNMFCSY
jgi:hypothetical protein